MVNPTDTHFYDGALRGASFAEPSTTIAEAAKTVTNRLRGHPRWPSASRALGLIVRDAGKPPNWDNTNRLRAGDLLRRVVESAPTDDVWALLAEQLADMVDRRGSCPQGRCVRLFMLLGPAGVFI